MFRSFLISTICAVALPLAAAADIVRVKAERDVASTADALQAAIENAGAKVFARVDHAGGAASVDLELPPAQLLIFGNPKLGTPAMQDDPLAGIFLPLRVLVYEDAEGTWLAYEKPADMLGKLDGVATSAKYIEIMTGALGKLTGKAAEGS